MSVDVDSPPAKTDVDTVSSPPVKTVRFGGRVVEILEKRRKGDGGDYEMLTHQLADPDIKDGQIINWLQELRGCVTQLTKDHEQLIYTVLRLPWVGRSRAVVEEYMAFLSNLVSAQTVYLCPCLRMVVSNFTPKRVTISDGGVAFSDSDDEDENLQRNFDQSHRALQLIVRYVPLASRFLVPVLQDKFPFVQKSSSVLECYVHNLLRVGVYVPSVRRDVLELIVRKLLELDVSVSRADIEEAEGDQNQEVRSEEALFAMDEEVSAPRPAPAGVMAHPVAQKLDALMDILLSYVRDVCYAGGVLDVDATKDLYRDLLSVFDRLILPTHAPGYVQFVLFYLCSFRLALAEAFLDHLWRTLQSVSQPAGLRQAAVGYLGSFLARAKFVPVTTVRACLDLLASWIHRYLDGAGPGGCDAGLHGPFYAACQTLFYTLVFRHHALLEPNTKAGLEYLQSLNLERVVTCQLNPLKVCLPSVTAMFAAITRRYQVVFCYSVMERNSRSKLPVVSAAPTCSSNPLDSFFPFDPYLLRRSGRLLQPLYQVWEDPQDLPGGPVPKEEKEEDFLSAETESVLGATPASYGSNICSSAGSPPPGSPPPPWGRPDQLLF